MKKGSPAFLILFIISLFSLHLNADALTVGTCAGGAYPTIQQAINSSSNGDTVEICSGIYNESIRINKKDLTLKGVDGQDIDDVVIKSSGDAVTIQVASDNGIRLENFKVESSKIGIYGNGNSNGKTYLKDLKVESDDNGLYFDKGFSSIDNVSIKSKNRAIHAIPSVNMSIDNSDIESSDEMGIYLGNGSDIDVSITNTKISAKDNGIQIDKASNILIDTVSIDKAKQGIRLSYYSHNPVIKNTVIKDTTDWALLLDIDSSYPTSVTNSCFYADKEVQVYKTR